ncbi:uroporphyrinogen decarboxylase [Spirochaetia bacterium]|nr:uroporphyrinogen decarboxylase [Spirochaetia bacterium]
MNHRENLLSLLRREGFSFIPVSFDITPDQIKTYREKTGSALSYQDYFDMPWRNIPDITLPDNSSAFLSWYNEPLKPGAVIDEWGIAHEPGSAAAKHMTHMRHPLEDAADPERIREYPFPDFQRGDGSHQKPFVDGLHERGLAAVGWMQMTIWEVSWYLRGMERLMMDMMDDAPEAACILDRITEAALVRAESYARAGADIIYLGDDIGSQRSPLMSPALYRTWLKPRLKRVIAAIKKVNPGIIIMYHSCGYVLPFIEDLIDAGVEVLNPIQAESMNYREIVAAYGDRLSFHGCIGTQTIMPFGTPEEIKAMVRDCVDSMGPKGGMFAAPTHILEPEVPWENILAYVDGCRNYGL